jgi:AP-1 complex subunit beta-1
VGLLDFDDEPPQEGPTGFAATQVLQQPAAKNIMSGTSTNPLDELVSIFRNTSLSSSASIPSAAPAIDPLGGFGGVSPATAVPSSSSNQQDDLLGLFWTENYFVVAKKWNDYFTDSPVFLWASECSTIRVGVA